MNWGEYMLPNVSNYTYLGLEWDAHIKRLIQNVKKKDNELHSIISNCYISLSAHMLRLSSTSKSGVW